ncbi:4-hydroxy-tetrahydrodipicolinate synthase [Rhizobium sp. VS19-DR104.2]|uniref:4-hydroxy-tetrahydrodipicolinate synthase n=1 Tax=unclassified Rhizobium TaxID=2613769 RepID=UPI001C5BF71C|nr:MULTISPECIES: 4-hydroxy-tetrahydrodipicolinate synthase [unclassified Rhizobium]MBZ5762463.1 4-hydroxy-tetrahydrodipicolinate synthase [Rhizobium sp. VS19-DR96]MBZ5768522.1 4-hydroxy-tetrahydrodipicolinate synthase [Rhizobium sp. VS19-DR129.2]MBZ5776040.1 4-hydroxy-tetrahydrodipicolinate synthase [Rhizobium sp. VS19-DRK62.2]MBZ5787188.1 4-hydroxy-tetrahydrodipicolinate synthase [Rhizobium sp. VS19-DR121]MBZ5804541.1 4-hydroxy-tetrahydrodipicolinate synthase [Rhizobium sp. VS19-DR181]
MTSKFRGVYTVMITPLDEDGAVDLTALAAFTDWQIREGIHGLIPLGSTGEFLSLSEDERDGVARTVIETAAGRVPVLIGTGAEDTRECVRLSKKAEEMGADGVMIIPPFYSTPTDDEIVHHYRTVASSISIPIMVYNNPATANVDLKPELVKRIAAIEGCDYIKESTLEVTRVRDIIRLAGDNMTVFGGILGFESFVLGAQGWVAVASNVAPGPMARIFELVVDEKNIDEARALYLKWLPVIQAVGGQAYVAGSKSLLNHMGFGAGQPRPPRLPLPAAQDAAIKKMVADFCLSFHA